MIGIVIFLAFLGSLTMFHKLQNYHPTMIMINMKTACVGFIFLIPITYFMIYFNLTLPLPSNVQPFNKCVVKKL